ncbi:NUDIX domain-containing protein [Paracoccus caeni]|uniref:NUDIX domain-containing protein n=1 Tax=Paracoccus caeni TaxID=657651 RepID=A0A934VXC0_9RHOB|nr:NUDIX domain-containing protein [Paracoccus caeni]MBK4214832.1 NUDIX domain-containing protein [Paracoccus caeni]
MAHFPRLAALAVTLRGDEVLLVRRRNPPDAGLWGFPGGHVEPGETALAAAARELAEETGIIATPRLYLDNVDLILRAPDGALRYHFLLAAVLCDDPTGDPVAADDALAAAWWPIQQVLTGNLPLSQHVDEVLRRALIMRSDPVANAPD